MKDKPDISVVMGVYNGAQCLPKTMESILAQKNVKLELIVVNDGSTDSSAAILQEYSHRDSRIKIIHQGNQGLTKALIRGCTEARGEYIARHDVGDVSYPHRLKKQLTCIRQNNEDIALVSCWTRFTGPGGEHLYDVKQDSQDATAQLLTTKLDRLRGPSQHGSTLFPKVLYEQVGGYRSSFYFAQDLDLWVRLVEKGQHVVVPEILCEASFSTEALSSIYRKEQQKTKKIILECTRLRRQGKSEFPAIKKAETIRPRTGRRISRWRKSKAFYFIGACLKHQGNPQATTYFQKGWQSFPLHLKCLFRLIF